jgi:hypothetical protein
VHNLEGGARDEVRGPSAADLERHDLVVVAVDHQGGDVDLPEVRAEVGGGERGDALVGGVMSAGRALEPEGVAEALVDVAAAVVPEERAVGEAAVELGPVGGLARADLVDDPDRQTRGVVVGRSGPSPDTRSVRRHRR